MGAPPVAERCRLKALELVCLCLLVLAALVVRVADTSWHPFGPDEGWTFDLAISQWQELVAKTAGDTHPPLHYAMVKLLFKAFGEDIYWGKLLSVAFATATLPLIFFLARIWFTPRAAWLAVVFAAFTPFQIYWSHVARNHLLLPFFTTGIVVLTELIRERPTRMWGVLMILAWIGAIQMNYMSFVFGFVWGVAYILLDRMPWRRKALLAAYTLPALASYIPWFAILRAHTEHSPMTIAFFQEFITPISLYYHSIFGEMTHLQPPQRGAWFVCTMLAFTLVVVSGWRAVGRRAPLWVMIVGFSGVPICIALMANFTLAERHLLYSLPFFFAYWGACCERIWALATRKSKA